MKEHSEYDNMLLSDNLKGESSVEHFFTTRNGGVSKGDFSTFNLGNFSDDNPIDIHENRQILSRMWYMDNEDFIIPHQTHSSNVLIVDDEFQALPAPAKIDALYGIDATITKLKNIFLCATAADCVPILLYDKKKEVIAAIHAGWKGIVHLIIENTVGKMMELYQCNPMDIVVAIGPSISIEHYEIGEDVVSKFKMEDIDLTTTSRLNTKSNKLHIDLKQISCNKLFDLGIPFHQIDVSKLCTYKNADLFFSARRQSVHCGRMLAGIKMIS